jgi:hypothetical protein
MIRRNITHENRQRTETLLRPLDQTEAHFAYLHAMMLGNTQVMTHLLVQGSVASDDLLRATHAVFNRFQILRTCIRERADQLWFLEHGDFCRVPVKLTGAESLQACEKDLQEELAEPVDSAQGLWRLRLVAIPSRNRSMIVLARNHAISDGFSTMLFFRELLAALAAVRDGTLLTAPCEPIACWPTPQSSAPHPVSVERVTAPALRFRSFVPVPQRTSRFLDLGITPQESRGLLAFCKRKTITVTQLLSAFLLKSFCRVTGVMNTDLFTAVSLRSKRFHEKPVLEMGCHITVARTVPSGIDSDTVTLARECGRLLEDAVWAWQPQQAPHMALRKQADALAYTDRFSGIAITNVGGVAGADFAGGVRPMGMRTVVNRVGANYAVVLHVLSFDGNLRATFAYSEPAMSVSDIEEMKVEFLALMEACL